MESAQKADHNITKENRPASCDEKEIPILPNRMDELRDAYAKVYDGYRSVADFRAKLLGLLPLSSGAGIFLVLTDKEGISDRTQLGFIGFIGIVVTIGLFLYELRGIVRCNQLIKTGRELERAMGLPTGQFTVRLDRRTGWIHQFQSWKGALMVAVVVYAGVGLGWGYVMGLGFGMWGSWPPD